MIKLEAFLATKATPLEAGRAKAALQEMQRFNGECWNRFAYAEAKIDEIERVCWLKGRIYKTSGAFFEIKSTTKTFAQYVEWLKAV
jgi:hypothetical protein